MKQVKEQTNCRKPSCKYHPQVSRLKYSWKRCIKCKHFVARDSFVDINPKE